MEYVDKWRLHVTTLSPEKVRVLPVSEGWVLVEGEEHTQYEGNFFNKAEEAFAEEEGDCNRSIAYYKSKLERLRLARERFEKSA